MVRIRAYGRIRARHNRRTTPSLLDLVSLILFVAYELATDHHLPIQQAVW
jgi:hypothetical protein